MSNEIGTATHDHIRRMELRIEHQTALITRLTMSGEDTLEAVKRLVLLRDTLAEMRVQLRALASPIRPARRADQSLITTAN